MFHETNLFNFHNDELSESVCSLLYISLFEYFSHFCSFLFQLQGSLRRKIEGHLPGQVQKQNGLSCGFPGSNFKRVCVDTGNLGHGSCSHNLTQPHTLHGSSAMNTQRKNFMVHHGGVGSDRFNMTLKEMKKEPVEVQSCGHHSNAEMIFDFKDEGGGQIDPELQDLFDELTKTVPTLNDLEFEKILKQDDAFGVDLGRPSSAGAPASLCSPMERPIKMEQSPEFPQVHSGSLQLRPASAGPCFTLTTTSSANTSQKATQASRAMPCWPEISHAEQLKQMAANQQQPSSLLHHHQAPPSGMSSWTPSLNTHSLTTTFPQDKVSSPAPTGQQRFSSQSKRLNNCLFKANTSHHVDMKVLSIKPTLHFSPKAPHSGSQPMPIMTSTVTTTSTQQQQQLSPSNGNQARPTLPFPMPQITAGPLCLQPKPAPEGMPFKLTQPRQVRALAKVPSHSTVLHWYH